MSSVDYVVRTKYEVDTADAVRGQREVARAAAEAAKELNKATAAARRQADTAAREDLSFFRRTLQERNRYAQQQQRQADTAAREAARATHQRHLQFQGALQGMGTMAHRAGHAFDRMASAVTNWGAVAGAAVVGGGIFLLKKGLIDVNAKMEEAKIGFATVFNNEGLASDFNAGLRIASKLMSQIRKDAAALPGETEDFINIAHTLASPLMHAGMGTPEIRELTARTAILAKASNIGFDQAGREMGMALTGNVGAHNILAQRGLGLSAQTRVNGKTFHDMSGEERFNEIMKRTAKIKESLPALEQSWAGVTSTFMDHVKLFLGSSTTRLFDTLKGRFRSLNKWIEDHPAQLQRLADVIDKNLVRAFNFLISKAEWLSMHWESIKDSAINMGEALKKSFESAWPIIQKVGSFLGEQMKDPGKFLMHLLEFRAGLAMLSNAPQLYKVGKWLGGGAGEAAAAGGVVAGEVGEAGIAAGGVAAGEAALSSTGIGALILAAGLGLVSVFTASKDSVSGWDQMIAETRDGLVSQIGSMDSWGGVMSDLTSFGHGLLDALKPLGELLGIFLLEVFSALGEMVKWVTGVLGFFGEVMKSAGSWISDKLGLNKKAPGAGEDASDDYGIKYSEWNGDYSKWLALKDQKVKHDKWVSKFGYEPREVGRDAFDADEHTHKTGTADMKGKGSTTINQVNNFTVLSDSDPERLAKRISHHIGDKLQNPLKALGAQSFRHA